MNDASEQDDFLGVATHSGATYAVTLERVKTKASQWRLDIKH